MPLFSSHFSYLLHLFSPPHHLLSVYQVLLQPLETWSPPSTRLRLSWTGAGRRSVAGAETWPSPSSANAAAASPLTAATVGPSTASPAAATSAFCREPRASTTPRWRWPTCWPTPTTRSRLKRRTGCRRWRPRWGSTPPSPSPPTRPVRHHSRWVEGMHSDNQSHMLYRNNFQTCVIKVLAFIPNDHDTRGCHWAVQL